MKLYYIANARMPTEKAHGIQIAKMCEAFIEAGVDLVLVVPRRKTDTSKSVRAYYGLRTDVPLVVLPALDWYLGGRFFYWVSAVTFMLSYLWYIAVHVDRKNAVLYTVDLDHVAYLGLPLLRTAYFTEMHGGKPRHFLYRIFFSHVRGVIATNQITREELVSKFGIPSAHTLVEPNAVDVSVFTATAKDVARERLGLPKDMRLALYNGRFFDWKGLEILPAAADLLKGEVTVGIVGGTKEGLEEFTGKDTRLDSLRFFGSQPFTSMPLWLSAADVFVVLGTRRDEQSLRYTSPMKLFEFMAIGRPIVASKTPALQQILSDRECIFYEPDDASSLAAAMKTALGSDTEEKVRAARRHVEGLSWQGRAQRIRAFMNTRLEKAI